MKGAQVNLYMLQIKQSVDGKTHLLIDAYIVNKHSAKVANNVNNPKHQAT